MNKTISSQKNIGIVGLGAGGLSYLVHLIDASVKNNKQISIDIFEKDHPSKGLAYSSASKAHILNLNSHVMSVSHNKPNHFYEWLVKEEVNWGKRYPEITLEDMYPPRSLFGEYLEDTFIEYLKIAKKHNIKVNIHKTEILDLRCYENGTIELQGSNQEIFTVNFCLLALGNFPSDKYTHLIGKEGYHHTPWKPLCIDREGPIVILGTRLTAIDTALYLANERKCKNKIYLISRSGALPKVIGPSEPYELLFLNKQTIMKNIDKNGNLSLDAIGLLFRKEIEHAEKGKVDWDGLIDIRHSGLESLQEEIAIVSRHEFRAWQSVLIALYPHVSWIWSLLTDEDKELFLAKYFSIWLVYLSAFPIQNAEKIRDLMQSGALEIISGVTEIEHTKEGFVLSFNKTTNIVTRTLINGTGSGHDPLHSKLISNMIKSGLIQQSRFGCLDIDVKSCHLILSSYKKGNNIYAIGEATFGSWLSTADLGQVSRQAEIAVQDLLINL